MILMSTWSENELEALSRASTLLAREGDTEGLISTMVDLAVDMTRSDVAAFYAYGDARCCCTDLTRSHQRGRYTVPDKIPAASETVLFIEESGESVVLLERKPSPFRDVLLDPGMQSGIALGVSSGPTPNKPARRHGALILNSREKLFYGRRRLNFLDSLNGLAVRLLTNAEQLGRLKAEVNARIDEPADSVAAVAERQATVLSADVSGYPVALLREHFDKIAETINKHRGMLGPFIGDSIQAVFWATAQSTGEEACRAVRCGLELQQLTAMIERALHQREVEALEMGIGIHSGPVFGGAHKSVNAMNHLILGSTVQMAERLKGIARAGDVIVTEATMHLVGRRFGGRRLSEEAAAELADSTRAYRVFERTDGDDGD